MTHGVITVAWNIQEDGGLRNATMLISMDLIKNRPKSHGLVYCGTNSENENRALKRASMMIRPKI